MKLRKPHKCIKYICGHFNNLLFFLHSQLRQKLELKTSSYAAENQSFAQIKAKISQAAAKHNENSLQIDSLKKRKCYLEQQIVDLQNHIDGRANE